MPFDDDSEEAKRFRPTKIQWVSWRQLQSTETHKEGDDDLTRGQKKHNDKHNPYYVNLWVVLQRSETQN